MRLAVALALTLSLAPAGRAEPVAVGSTLPEIRLADQHDAPWALDATVRTLLVTHDMDGGSVVREALGDTPQATLDAAHVAYVADIAGMPALVSRLMAVPRMRRRTYRIMLDRDGAATRVLPRAEGMVTVVRLEALRVTAIEQIPSPAALRAALAL